MQDNQVSTRATLFYFKILIFSTYLGAVAASFNFMPKHILGFALSGYAWIIVFFVSLYYLFFVIKKTRFPILIWLPWVLYLILSLGFHFSFLGLQSTVQILVPVFVGVIAGGFEYDEYILKKILSYLKYLLFTILVCTTLVSYLSYGILGFGPATYAHLSAVGAIVVIGLFYSTNEFRYILFYLGSLLIPILLVTRMGIAVTLIVPLIYFSKKINFRRIILAGGLIILGNAIFLLPSVQKKMFYSGEGQFSELSWSNPNLQTSGRKAVAELALKEARNKPIFGHGPRADYHLLKKYSNKILELHNDYLQIYYNYGRIGLVLYFLATFLIFIMILRIRSEIGEIKFLKSVLLTMYLPLVAFMLTDTTIKSSFSFMNYFFALQGMICSLYYGEKYLNRKTLNSVDIDV